MKHDLILNGEFNYIPKKDFHGGELFARYMVGTCLQNHSENTASFYLDHDDTTDETLHSTAVDFLKSGCMKMPYKSFILILKSFSHDESDGLVWCLENPMKNTSWEATGTEEEALLMRSGITPHILKEYARLDFLFFEFGFVGNILYFGDYISGFCYEHCQAIALANDDIGVGPAEGNYANAALGAILGSTMLLNTKYAQKDKHSAPIKVNEKRKKKGKPLLRDYVIVKLRQSDAFEGGAGHGGNHRSSPRPHWRRGHIRTIQSGKVIPIPPVIVNMEEGRAAVSVYETT